MSAARTPVTLVTGFLGSGKTTLLNRLVGTPAFARAAVVVNEFGEMAIDPLLIASPAEQLIVLDNGCICCSARGDLAGALRRLAHERADGRAPFDRVLVETTGVADPAPLMETLCEDAHMASRYRPYGVVTLVDAVNGAEQLASFAEPVKQVAVADRLLVSKADIAAAPPLAALEASLRALNPGAPIVRVVTGTVDAATALGTSWQAQAEREFDWLETARRATHVHAASIGHLAAPGMVETFSVLREQPATRAGLVLWLDKLAGLKGARLLRMKGVVNVEGEPVAVHAVQRIVHEPVVLPRWPDDERRSRLVFITRGLAREEVMATLDALGLGVYGGQRSRLVDPEAYARFLAASRGF